MYLQTSHGTKFTLSPQSHQTMMMSLHGFFAVVEDDYIVYRTTEDIQDFSAIAEDDDDVYKAAEDIYMIFAWFLIIVKCLLGSM